MIRPTDPERDGPGATAMFREFNPWFVARLDAWLWWQARIPERARYRGWTAEVDGEFAGRAEAGLNWFAGEDASAFVFVLVREARRDHGVGRRLAQVAEEYAESLGRRRILSNFLENERGVRFVEARGYRPVRAETLSAVDPRHVETSAVDAPPDGIRVVVATEVPEKELWQLDITTTPDVPSSDPLTDIPFEEWKTFWESPRMAKEGSFAVLDGGRAVAATLINADLESGRALNNYTCTLPSHRGRGLATLAKLASMRWAAEHGIVSIATTNDERNAPMLAINRKLGYVRVGRMVEYGRDL